MKVGIFTDIYRPRIGGTTISVITTFRSLKMAGAFPILFAPKPDNVVEEESVIYFPTIRFPLGGTMIRTAVPYSRKVADAFIKSDINIVHSFSPFFVGYTAKFLARRRSVPTVFTYQTRYEEYLHFLPFGKRLFSHHRVKQVVGSLLPPVIRAVCNSFDCVVVPTKTVSDYLKGIGVKTRIEIIPVGFDILSMSENAIDVREQLGIPSNVFLLLHVGRLSLEKNVRFLLKAFSIALNQNNNLMLLIVGDGPERDKLQKLASGLGVEKKILFVGAVPHEYIGSYYQAADCFVFSSTTDTQAFVISESLIFGVPPIAIDAPGPHDFIVNGVNGILTPADEEKFAHAIVTLSEDYNLRERLSRNAVKARVQLSLQHYAESLLALYRDLTRIGE